MSKSDGNGARPLPGWPYVSLLVAGWTLLIAASCVWNLARYRKQIREAAKAQARASIDKDILYRRWNARHGGVYAPVAGETQPNPYLDDPGRDLTTPSGQLLTKINPAYMTRQVHELGRQSLGVQSHITSLKPIRPANVADEWETTALKAFEGGEAEASESMEIDGKRYLRLMRPLMVEQSCLSCHAAQGYRVGDVRGGISVTVPIAPSRAAVLGEQTRVVLYHSLLWLVGLYGIIGRTRYVRSVARESAQVEQELRDSLHLLDTALTQGGAAAFYRNIEPSSYAYLGDGIETITGYRADEMTPRVWESITEEVEFMGDLAGCSQEEARSRFRAGAANRWQSEVKIRTKSGETRWAWDMATARRDASGRVVGALGIVQDLTERKQIEQALRDNEEAEHRFSEQLTALHDVTIELGMTSSRDELCRRAIELGRSRLGFDRLSVWFATDEQGVTEGSFGVDAQGQIQDERGRRVSVSPDSVMGQILARKMQFHLATDTPLRNDRAEVVGHGSLAVAGLWDGEEVIGSIATDNLIRHEPITDRQCRLLALYASALGHLCTRKRAEEELKATAAELERSNTELKQYAYVASHDLQEPLRAVVSYLQLLERRHKSGLDADAAKFVTRAVAAAARMRELIRDLLAYARVETRGGPLQRTDSASAVSRAIADLRVAIEENDAVVTHGDLPTAMADPTQLAQLFQNLIANAIKFRRDEPPCIHISAEADEESAMHLREAGIERCWQFSVRDNGIGIDPQYAERIFVIFQRLHTRTEYPGTGIGLAICKRIVERHGGRIWVDSEPGQGSTLCFTIPHREGAES